MSTLLLLSLVLIPVFVLCLLSAFTYYDATDVGMENPKRWAAIVLFVPIYGFIIYLLARSELDYDPETDPYAGGRINVHPSRADDVYPRGMKKRADVRDEFEDGGLEDAGLEDGERDDGEFEDESRR